MASFTQVTRDRSRVVKISASTNYTLTEQKKRDKEREIRQKQISRFLVLLRIILKHQTQIRVKKGLEGLKNHLRKVVRQNKRRQPITRILPDIWQKLPNGYVKNLSSGLFLPNIPVNKIRTLNRHAQAIIRKKQEPRKRISPFKRQRFRRPYPYPYHKRR